MATTFTYPGVYINEINAFPNSVVGVPTAIPAFIGYTQQALVSGQSVLNQPVPLSSMAEFTQYFGGPPNPQYVFHTTAGSNADFSVPYATSAGTETLSFIVSPTQNKFILYYAMQLFFANGGSNCYVVSVGDYSGGAISYDDLYGGLTAISNQVGPTILAIPDAVNLSTLEYFQQLTSLMIEQAGDLKDRVAILDLYDATAVTQQNVSTSNSLATCVTNFTDGLATVSSPNTYPNYLSYGMAYFPWLNTTVVDPGSIDYTNFEAVTIANEMSTGFSPISPAIQDIQSPYLSPYTMGAMSTSETELQEILTLFNLQQYANDLPTQALVQSTINGLNFSETNLDVITSTNNYLTNALPQYASLLQIVAAKTGVLPPSAAMAGAFSLSDSTQGVWNAPANMVLASVTSPTVNLTDAQQGPLNVPVNGMAIDVIRSFQGRGTVIWGARTLEGNSPDWRYIQVRRTIIYIEQSIKQAINQYVFAPNVASTWVSVTQMISGFLQQLWSQGGLMGSKASSAFNVQCGVPTTMTATDILNGVMIVQVTLQMVHPAEFIELQFTQTMQGS